LAGLNSFTSSLSWTFTKLRTPSETREQRLSPFVFGQLERFGGGAIFCLAQSGGAGDWSLRAFGLGAGPAQYLAHDVSGLAQDGFQDCALRSVDQPRNLAVFHSFRAVPMTRAPCAGR